MIHTEPTKRRRPPRFELLGGAVCLDFVNTLDDRFSSEGKELLKSYIDLARFGEDTGIIDDFDGDRLLAWSMQHPEEAQRALAAAIQLREALSEIFYAVARKKPVPSAALIIFNRHLRESMQHLQLVPGKARFAWNFDIPQHELVAPLWAIARDAAELLSSDHLEFVRACASKTCEWLFLDESKNHRRRWCDMTKCGNRAKVKRFYLRQKKMVN